MSFAENLIRARKEKGLSQIELADAIGVSKGTIGNYEAGRRTRISVPIIKALALVLDVDPGELVAGMPGIRIIGVNDEPPKQGNNVPSFSVDELNIPEDVKTDPHFTKTVRSFIRANEDGKGLIADVAEVIADRTEGMHG